MLLGICSRPTICSSPELVATADQIKALIKSHAKRDDERFYATAMQLAAHEARQGHGKLATELKELVDQAKTRRVRPSPSSPTPIARPRGELAGLLAVSYPETSLGDMVLSSEVRDRLDRMLREQRARQKLQGHGLSPRRKLLLVGPPGCGKTMTASALAGELHLPLYVVVLHGLITKFMGETAAKLSLIFQALAEQRGVYLFDEFDAIGGERSTPHDVGEIRRVLNSFLQFLEQDDSESVVVAATNHPQALDRALFRRFDDVIEYRLPDQQEVVLLVQEHLGPFELKEISWEQIYEVSSGLSHAEIVRAAESAAKTAVLDGESTISTDALAAALRERAGHSTL